MLADRLAKASKAKHKEEDDDAEEAFKVLAAALNIPEPKRASARAAVERYLACREGD